jgi:hypothetical protein
LEVGEIPAIEGGEKEEELKEREGESGLLLV